MRLKANGKLYDFPSKPPSIGEARIIKQVYGIVFGRDEIDLLDPDHAAAFLYRAMREADPNLSSKVAVQAVDEITELDIVADDGSELTGDEDESEAVPTGAPEEAPETGS